MLLQVYWKDREAFAVFDISNTKTAPAQLLTCSGGIPSSNRLAAKSILGEALPEGKATIEDRPFAKVSATKRGWCFMLKAQPR